MTVIPIHVTAIVVAVVADEDVVDQQKVAIVAKDKM
jgi:hypothetical protein